MPAKRCRRPDQGVACHRRKTRPSRQGVRRGDANSPEASREYGQSPEYIAKLVKHGTIRNADAPLALLVSVAATLRQRVPTGRAGERGDCRPDLLIQSLSSGKPLELREDLTIRKMKEGPRPRILGTLHVPSLDCGVATLRSLPDRQRRSSVGGGRRGGGASSRWILMNPERRCSVTNGPYPPLSRLILYSCW